MANQKTKYTEVLYVRVTPGSKEWANRKVPSRFPSLSAYVDFLIHRERLRANYMIKKGMLDEEPREV